MRRNDRNESTEVVLYWLGAAEDNRAWLYQLMAETQPEDLADRLREETRGAIWYGTGGETGFRPPVDDWASVDWKHVAAMCKAGAIPGPELALGGGPGIFPIIALRKLLAPALLDCTSPDQLADELRARAARVRGSDRDFPIDWRGVARYILETSEEMVTTLARERIADAFDELSKAEAAYEAQHDPDGPDADADALDALAIALSMLEKRLREAADALKKMHRMRGNTLDRLAAQIMTDATAGAAAGKAYAGRRMLELMQARNWTNMPRPERRRMLERMQRRNEADGTTRDNPARPALRAAAHALELAEYVANIEGTNE